MYLYQNHISYKLLLTPTQIRIISKMVEGLRQTEIAENLKLSKIALYRHVNRARIRIGARTVHEMISRIVVDEIKEKRRR